MSNTGFVDVLTQPAGRGSVSVPDLGTFALLAGPTVASYGTVFLSTLEGSVIALHPDGTPHWSYQLPAETIRSSPVVGSDGSVYVVSGATGPIAQAKLYKFSPVGGAPIVTDFPTHDRGPMSLGPPNVWQFEKVQGIKDEAIMVPALYPTLGGTDLHLLAFSPSGGVMADWSLFLSGGDVTEGGSWDALLEKLTPFHFHPGTVGGPPPFPNVAIGAAPQGGTPFVMLVDRYFRQTIGFTFCVDRNGSCAPEPPGFSKLFNTPHDPRRLWSAPMIMPDMHTVVGTDDGVVFSGPSAVPMPPVTGLGYIIATPTLAANGDVVLVNDGGDVSVLRDGAIVSPRVSLSGITMARAAASRSHVFVSTTEALYTLDANAAASVFRFPWYGGGLWSPAIGPEGHVYAMASNVLFVFPPPRTHGDPHGLEALRGSLVSG
jgi:PQQ-like domain